MNEAWGLRVLKGLLAWSSAPWRARFEEQAKADLEDAWNDLPADRRAAWVMATGWDLLKGAVRSNLQRQPQAVLATAGGGAVIPKEVVRFMVGRLPGWLGLLTVVLGGAFLLGLGAYDVAQYKVATLVGLVLVLMGLRPLERLATHANAPSKNASEQLGHNLLLVIGAAFVCAIYFLTFGWVEDQAMAASKLGMTPSFAAVIPLPVSGLLMMVAMAVGCSVLALFARAQAPRKASLLWFGLVLGMVGFVFKQGSAGDFNAYGLVVLAGTLGFLLMAIVRRWGQYPTVRWPLLFIGSASLPMLLGFLVALNLDTGRSSLEEPGQSQPWSLLDMAKSHSDSLNDVRAGRQPPEAFWSTVTQLQAHQAQWSRYKPLMRLVTPQRAGIRARDWCMAQHAMAPDFGANQCATLPEPDRWLTENPAP